MLQNIRERFTGTTALVVLGLIAVPFIFVGVSSPLIGSGYAAKVDGEDVSLALFENTWQNQVAQNPDYLNYPPRIQSMLREQILDRLIRDRLVLGYLNDAGMRISEKMVTDLVQGIPDYQQDGVFSMEKYREGLSLQNRTTREFEATVARSLRLFQLQQAIASTAFVTPGEYRRYLNLFGEQRQVTVATIAFTDIQASVEVSDEEIAEYYNSRPDEFYSEESADIAYIEMRRDALSEQAKITEEDLQLYYESAGSRYLQDEQRRARHILILFGDDEKAASEQARALTARLQAGEPFDGLARQYSKDGGTANNGGDLGLVPHSQMPDALGDAIFSMRKGELRGPVKGDFGFHVVRLDEIVEGGPLPLEQVRAELERELRDRQADVDFRALENEVTNALFDSLDLQAMAAAVGLEVKAASGFSRSGGEPFGGNQAVIDAVFDTRVLHDGQISDIVEIDANRSIVVQVTEYHEAAAKSLVEVTDQIRVAVRSMRAQELIADAAEQLRAMLLRGDEIATAAASVGAVVSPATVVKRSDTGLDARLLAAVFRSKKPLDGKPQIGAAITQNGDHVVFSLSGVAPGRAESIPLAERDKRKNELATESGAADFTAFLGELALRADIVKNEAVLQAEESF